LDTERVMNQVGLPKDKAEARCTRWKRSGKEGRPVTADEGTTILLFEARTQTEGRE